MDDDAFIHRYQTLLNLAEICARQGVEHIIVSPGSRSAPLTVAFARHPKLRCRVVMDERAAGFIALGMAQQTGRPVGLVCTSGTAPLNYAPAVTEAFFQQIPLLVFTADRPPEWIDQQDNQTTHQHNIYGSHSRANFELPVDYRDATARWHAERLMSEAINQTQWPIPGPVHINAPFREPLYPDPALQLSADPKLKTITLTKTEATLAPEAWQALAETWQQAQRKLVIAGLTYPDSALSEALNELQQDPSVTVISDIASNLHQGGTTVHHADMILGTKSETDRQALAPDLVVSFGGPVVSKYLKLFLRAQRPTTHWYLDPGGQTIDTFQALTEIISIQASTFFKQLQQHVTGGETPTDYQTAWRQLDEQATALLPQFFEETSFSEFHAVKQVMSALPADSLLQLGNSMPIRYASFVGMGPEAVAEGIRVNSNRGTSGIDGTVSTTVGAALTTEAITTLITGDLAFFYDRNGLWHNHVPPNLRIVLLNNGGGGIFKLINGPNNLAEDELHEFFFTPQSLNAKNTAQDHNLAYFTANTADELHAQLPDFFNQQGAAILEIFTDVEVNTEVFEQFKKQIGLLKIG